MCLNSLISWANRLAELEKSLADDTAVSTQKAKIKGLVLADKYRSYLNGLAYGPKDNMRRIKLYTVKRGDTFQLIAKKTLGSSIKARTLAYLNGMPENAQLIPGAKIKTIY